MKQETRSVRREFLWRAVVGFTGLFTGTAALGTASGSRLFAGHFLRDKHSKSVPEGYYDASAQLYYDAATKRPMFVAAAGEPANRLSPQELLDLINSGRFVDVSKNPLFGLQQEAVAFGWATGSEQTTLSTTSCCPIVTDSSRDRGPDDYEPNPPRD